MLQQVLGTMGASALANMKLLALSEYLCQLACLHLCHHLPDLELDLVFLDLLYDSESASCVCRLCIQIMAWNTLSALNNDVEQYAAQATYHSASLTEVA